MSRLMLLDGTDVLESIGLPCHMAVVLEPAVAGPLVRRLLPEERLAAPVLAPAADGHVLITPPDGARVQGLPLLAGTCRLLNGDTIQLDGLALRYVTHDFLDPERLEPMWLPAIHSTEPVLCAACLDPGAPLQPGDGVAVCPNCRWGYHPGCLADPALAECPICACQICRTDTDRAAFMSRTQGG